jgi:hypothetical protein
MRNRQPDIHDRCFGLLTDVDDLRDVVQKLRDSRLVEHLDKMSELLIEFIYQYADGVKEPGR